MKNAVLIFLLAAQLALAACSPSGSSAATAVIRVTAGNQAGAAVDDLVTTALTSFSFAQHADQVLGLAKQWGVPARDADERIRTAISVRKGKQPDLFIVEASGLDHPTAVKIVNELCSYYGTLRPSVALSGGRPTVIRVSVVEPAK